MYILVVEREREILLHIIYPYTQIAKGTISINA